MIIFNDNVSSQMDETRVKNSERSEMMNISLEVLVSYSNVQDEHERCMI